MSPKASDAASKSALTFEAAFARLREIAAELEADTLSLEESLKRYEEATVLSARCQELLQEAEDRITVLQNGNYVPLQVEVSE